MTKLTVKGKGIAPLVTRLIVVPVHNVVDGFEPYSTEGLDGEYEVMALREYRYEDGSTTAVAILNTPKGMREVVMSRLRAVAWDSPSHTDCTGRDRPRRSWMCTGMDGPNS